MSSTITTIIIVQFIVWPNPCILQT